MLKVNLLNCFDCVSSGAQRALTNGSRQSPKVILNIEGNLDEGDGMEVIDGEFEFRRFWQSIQGSRCEMLLDVGYWLCLCGAHIAGAVLITFGCFVLNVRLDAVRLVHGRLLVKDAALLVSCVFWMSWCFFSIFLGAWCFTCCEEWPSVLGNGEPKLFAVFALWLVLPIVLVVWCFISGSLHAALSLVFGLLPVALLIVLLRAMFMTDASGRRSSKRARSQKQGYEMVEAVEAESGGLQIGML